MTPETNKIEINVDKLTRLEVINHAKNDSPVGRLLTLYKEMGDFNNLEFSIQDGGRTLKIFLLRVLTFSVDMLVYIY